MNIVTVKNKKAVWENIKEKQPDISQFIENVCKAFPGRYKAILVEKRED